MENGKIVIIDDEIRFSKFFAKRLGGEFNEEIVVMNIYDKKYFENNLVDLVTIDIDMGNIDGIKNIATDLNRLKHKPKIIFVSNNVDSMKKTFSKKPIYFIDKSNLEEDLKEALILLYKSEFRKNTRITLFSEIINVNELVCVEACKNYIDITLSSGKVIRARGTIKEAEKILTKYKIIRVHKSHIINVRYINNFIYNEFVLSDRISIPVGRNYKNEVMNVYKEAIADGLI
ncbi:MAG: LytR/AlgR family response regulator transcription factor [Coprobacillaceae bacterium]